MFNPYLLGLGLMFCAPLHAAQSAPQDNLSKHLAPGLWELRYERHAVIKAVGHDKIKRGSSLACVTATPRKLILDWFDKTQCKVAKESLKGKTWRLEGSCQVRWHDNPLPIRVVLEFADGKSFVLDASTPKDKLISYRDHTVARRLGADCPGKS